MYYCLAGGEYETIEWKKLIEGTLEKYGPYDNEKEALTIWKEKCYAKMDNAHHRIFLYKHENRIDSLKFLSQYHN